MKNVYENVACAGVDVHYKSSDVTFRDSQAQVVRRERLDHRDREKLRRQLSRWPEGLPVVMEASFGWAWLSDVMLEVGLEPHLSNCYKVEQMRKARGLAKTNKKDADLLSLLWFERSNWWEVWLAPPAVRQQRELMRYRSGLVRVQTGTKGRIHAIFHCHGIFHEFSDLFGVAGWRFLRQLCAQGDAELPAVTVRVLGGQLALLEQLRKQLGEVGRDLQKQLETTPLTRRLDMVPGFGLILSHTVRAEVGVLGRFRGHRRLASYSLLAPMSHDTGEMDGRRAPLGRHLGRRGNLTLKWAFIEAAHGAVRTGGRWRAMFDRHTQGGKSNCNRGYIKVARELVKVIYAVWKNGTTYMATPPPRPGSGRRHRKSRSGTGQPSRPMVAAE